MTVDYTRESCWPSAILILVVWRDPSLVNIKLAIISDSAIIDYHAITIIAFHLLFFLFLADPIAGFCPLQLAITPPNFIPIIGNNICAEPPGTVATDGCDEVCLLTTCCKVWTPSQHDKVKLQDGSTIDCSTVNCGNVCRLDCDRQGTPESCTTDCTSLSTDGKAYIFSRPGGCDPLNVLTLQSPVPDPTSPTHVGFGFQVARDIYVFGSVENGAGCANVPGGHAFDQPGNDNGFWMTTGTEAEMLATFQYPPSSMVHGTISPIKAANYTQYKITQVETPNVCTAVKAAEDLYYVGYTLLFNNCLDAVYNVLKAYGVTFACDVNPVIYWCPSGTSLFSFFGRLGGGNPTGINNWSDAAGLNPGGTPVVAIQSCPPGVPETCGGTGAPVQSPGDTCGGADFTNCPACGGLGPTCFVDVVPLTNCGGSCATIDPCTCTGSCSQGGYCYSWSRVP